MSRPTRLVVMILATYAALDLLALAGLNLVAQFVVGIPLVAGLIALLDALERRARDDEK